MFGLGKRIEDVDRDKLAIFVKVHLKDPYFGGPSLS